MQWEAPASRNYQTVQISAVTLAPGLATRVTKANLPAQPYLFNTRQTTGWLAGEFHFRETPLAEVFREIERQFKVRVLPETIISGLQFTGRFTNGNMNEALDIICLSSGLSYSIKPDSTILIYE